MWPFPKKSVMHPYHKDLINGNIVVLSKKTKNLKELMKCLEISEIINLYEIAVINKSKSNSERCYKLYQLLLKKDSTVFKILVKSLIKTDNESLAKFLWGDEDESILLEEDEIEIKRRKQSIENAAIILTRTGPKPQTITSIIISTLILLISAAIPFSIGIYMFKVWIDRIF